MKAEGPGLEAECGPAHGRHVSDTLTASRPLLRITGLSHVSGSWVFFSLHKMHLRKSPCITPTAD